MRLRIYDLRMQGAVALAMALLFAPATASAQAPAGCEYEPMMMFHPDGIAKRYCGRQIAHVMGWQGADWLNRPERLQEERTDLLIQRLALKAGTVVGDIGAGTGSLSRQMARNILPGGAVWAVDLQPQMVSMLKRVASEFPDNVFQVRQTTARQVNIPDSTLDMAVMVDVYHEFEYPREMLQSILRATKPGGRVVFVEYRANDAKVPIKPIHTMSLLQIRREAEAVGLVFEKADQTLPWQDIVTFQKP